MLNLECFGKERKKEKEKGKWKWRRPEWATTHFESFLATEEVCRDKVPLALCRDKGFHVAIGLVGLAHDTTRARATGLFMRLERARDNSECAHNRDSRSCVVTELLCRDRVWG